MLQFDKIVLGGGYGNDEIKRSRQKGLSQEYKCRLLIKLFNENEGYPDLWVSM